MGLQGFQALEGVWNGFGDLPDRPVGTQQLSAALKVSSLLGTTNLPSRRSAAATAA
jgi:hypothetical protein